MRNIWQTQHHIRFFAWVMAAVIGLLPPFAALAAEENISEENTEQEDTAEEDSEEENEADEDADEKESVSGDDLDDEASISYITAFEPLAEEEAYLSCTEKPGLEDLTAILPETLVVWLEGEEESADLEVEWESEEDFDNTALERYVFYPVWDEALYVPADSVKDTIEIPNITVEVPADEGMIPELEEAKNALQSIIENKSVLALVYLCDSYEVKSEPSAEADTVHTVVSGQTVQITDADLDENGSVWYRTLFYQNGQEYTGYIERGYLAASDEDFMQWEESYIALPPTPMMRKSRRAAVSYPDVDQFPASYQNALYELKNKHPNWVFVKMETGIDWNTAIAKEMGDKSLVPSGSSGSWQNGVYGQGWSYASEGILKYYMDPRNFLTDPAVFQFEQLTYNQSYHTAGAVQEIVKSSFMSSAIPGDSRTYAQAFTTIGQSTGVSPFHLASRVLQEQGTKGTSALISGTYPGYEGYYNYFNVNASGKTDAQVVQNGLKKAKEQGWNTRYKSLNGGAYIIGANYILKGQDTLYLEKFNVSNGYYANFTHQYMQNIQAPNSEASSIRKAYSNAGALENSFVFKIPVFRNMPASACTKPNTTDVITFDKTAVSLAVNKTVKLIPYVNGSKVDYISNMTFKSDAPAVATVDDVGRVTAVSPGTAVISCIGGKGGTAVCKVTVVKADPEVATPTLSPCTYREGLKLSDISLPAGWVWANESLKIEVGTQSQEAVYTPEDTVNYNTITRKISFTVTKAIPNCTMPEKPRVFTGSRLGDIALPKGFVWESDTDTVFKEPGEYTFYVSYNPDENNYYPVEHIPLIVQVAGETIDPGEEDGSGGSTGTGSGTGSGDNTGTGSGTGSGDNTGTGSGTGSGGNTGTGGDNTGTGSGTGSGGNTGTGGDNTGTGSGTGSGDNTGTGSGTGSGDNTGTGSGTGSGDNTGTGSGTGSGNNTGTGSGTGSGDNTGTGSGTGSGDNTGTGSGTGSGNNTGTGSTGNTTTGSSGTNSGSHTSSKPSGSDQATGSSNNGAPLTQLPNHGSSSGGSQSTQGTSGSKPEQNASGGSKPEQSASGSSQPEQSASGSSQPEQSASGSSQSEQSASGSSQPDQSTSDSGQSTQSTSGDNQSNRHAADNSQSGQHKAGNSQSSHTAADSEKKQESAGSDQDVKVVENGAEAGVSKPAVTMSMEDTTILTAEKLQMAKEQNLDLLLDMGRYAKWSIDIDSVDVDSVTEVDMGISLGTERIPTDIIAAILNGNKYLEFTLAHDGPFGFSPVLQIAFDPMYEGWYANLFYYKEEAQELEFICDAVIDSNGIASFDMEHASSYVVIVSETSMAGAVMPDDSAVPADSAAPWGMIGVIVCLTLVGIGIGIFFYGKRRQENDEEEDDEEEDEEEDDEEEDDEEEDEEEDDEELDEEWIEEEESDWIEEAENEEDDWIEDEDWQEPENDRIEDEDDWIEEQEESENEEDDWIEDEDWQEPEVPVIPKRTEKMAQDRLADDHAEDDWIEDEEWDIENDWIEDEEWERRKEA